MDLEMAQSLKAIYDRSQTVETKVQEVWNGVNKLLLDSWKLRGFAWAQTALLALILWRVW